MNKKSPKGPKGYFEWVLRCGCLLCRRPAEIHHVMHMQEKATRRDDRYVVALCPDHHRHLKTSVHGLGSERAFKEEHGIDLVEHAQRNWSHGQLAA